MLPTVHFLVQELGRSPDHICWYPKLCWHFKTCCEACVVVVGGGGGGILVAGECEARIALAERRMENSNVNLLMIYKLI
jgi:hypothetical protein